MRPNISVYIPLGGYPKQVIECVFTVLHTVHTCEYCPTSQFAHLLVPFLGRVAFFRAIVTEYSLGIECHLGNFDSFKSFLIILSSGSLSFLSDLGVY